jgi:hypothetical protein
LELLGKKEGVCSGIGSSQHLQKFNFFSNGIQGGIMPIAAGFALGNKLNNSNNIGIVFIGDGTLGEGVVYETLNFLSIKKIPLIVVCENNMYAQSTPSSYNIAGEIKNRALAFDIEFRESETFNLNTTIMDDAKSSIDYVRTTGKPIFLSTGMSSMDQVAKAVSLLNEKKLVLMHTVSTYPAVDSDLNLSAIETLREAFPNIPIGYSGHEVGVLPSLIAVAKYGAVCVERHITLDRASWGSDQAASSPSPSLMLPLLLPAPVLPPPVPPALPACELAPPSLPGLP